MREIKGGKITGESADGINDAEIGDKKGVRGVFEPLKGEGVIKSNRNK